MYSTILSHHREFNGKQNITTMIRSWHERNFSIIGALFAETISHVSLLRTELAMQNCVTGNVTLNRTLVRTPEFDTMTTYDVILLPQMYCGIRFLPKWCNTHHEIWHEIIHGGGGGGEGMIMLTRPKMSWMASSWFPYDWNCAVVDNVGLHQHNCMILNKTQTFNNRKQWHQY